MRNAKPLPVRFPYVATRGLGDKRESMLGLGLSTYQWNFKRQSPGITGSTRILILTAPESEKAGALPASFFFGQINRPRI